ncbi:MAG: DUF2341 domain-containing protein, partial [Candidatus Thorarchaeota archaeon]
MSEVTKKKSGIYTVTAMLFRKAAIKFTLNIAVLLIALLTFASIAQAAAPANEWWDSNYQYQYKVSVTAGSTNIPTDYSVRIEFDHAALVATGKSLSSGDDIRIAHWNGSTWTELDRRLDDQSSWDSATTQVWFRTQAAINASQTDDDYYIYYGYSSAGSPPTTWSNVFLFYDDFNDGTLDSGRWSCEWGTCTESGGTLTLGTNNSVAWATATYALGTDTRWETRAQLGGDGSVQYFNYCGAGNTNDWSGDWIDFWTTSTTHNLETANNAATTNNNYTPNTPTSSHVYGFNREGASGVRFYQDGTQVGYNTTNLPDANLRFLLHNDNSTSSQIHDWVRVRKYVSPEPTNVIGGEEPFSGAIVFDAASNSTGGGQGASISWDHTVTSSGSNRILVVGVSWRNAGADTWTVSSVTYNSLPLTPIRKDEKFDSESRSTALYYLTDPPTGSAYPIQVNYSGTTVYRSVGGAVSLTGVDQSNPVDAQNGIAGATGTNPSVTVTTNTDGAWVVDALCIRNATGTTSADGVQDERWNLRTAANNIDGAGSTMGPKSPAGDVTMSWTTGTNGGHSISAVALKPASGSASALYRSVGTNGAALASGGASTAGRVFDEQYENPGSPGYDESPWIETGSPNENMATSGITGAPSEWGDESLEAVFTGSDVYAEGNFNGTYEKSFLRLEFILDSESLSPGDSNRILDVEDDSWSNVYYLNIVKTGGGALKLNLACYHNGGWNSYNSFADLSLDTRYRVEVKWDSTAGVDEWSWKLDGVVQPNDQDSTYPVETEGILTATHSPNVRNTFIGTMWSTGGNMTTYFDLFALDDSDWVGPANGLTVSGSTATFEIDLDNQIGVGDVIQYDSDGNGSIDALAFIHGRTDSQTY